LTNTVQEHLVMCNIKTDASHRDKLNTLIILATTHRRVALSVLYYAILQLQQTFFYYIIMHSRHYVQFSLLY